MHEQPNKCFISVTPSNSARWELPVITMEMKNRELTWRRSTGQRLGLFGSLCFEMAACLKKDLEPSFCFIKEGA